MADKTIIRVREAARAHAEAVRDTQRFFAEVDEAAEAYERAAALTGNRAERAYLRRQITTLWCPGRP